MKRKVIIWMLCVLAVVGLIFAVPAFAAGELQPYVTDADTTADAVLEAWASGSYSYIQLGNDLTLTLGGENIIIDLAGNDLTVDGSGKVNAFDSANDTYDHTLCGTLTLGGSVTCASDYTAPNGNCYIALTDGSRSTFHRLEMKLTAVSLRMSCAGVYYKAYYACDRLMEEKVQSYGVAVSTNDMPGRNFATAGDDLYTVVDGADFVSGATVNSGIVENIMHAENWTGAENLANSQTKIYARGYINIDGRVVMGNTGAASSLMDLMTKLDGQYSSLADTVQRQLDDFHGKWKTQGVDWSFTNIGQNVLDFDAINAPLSLDAEGKAYCHICKETVTWTALTDEKPTVVNGGHYYLTQDVTYTGTATAYFNAPSTGGHKACLHLNEHNITATQTKAIYGGGSVLSVMGNGTVAGYATNDDQGAAIYTNNRNANNGINLYGGTYTRVSTAPTKVPVIALGDNGRAISIYEGATIDGGSTLAIRIAGDSGRQKQGYVKLLGCTVNGNLSVSAFNTYVTNVLLDDVTINGTFSVPNGQNVVLSGKVNITKLVVPEGLAFTTNGLEEGTVIGIDAAGIFTGQSSNVADYVDYFIPADTYNGISVRDNALHCGKDYTSDIELKFAEGTTEAACPICEKTVTWYALTQDYVGNYVIPDGEDHALNLATLDAGMHYYLAEDITADQAASVALIRAPGYGKVGCLHLNGHDLTATATKVIFGGSGTLNVLGTGTVSGRDNKSSGVGSTVQINTSNAAGTINLYSGTYQQAENAGESEYTINIQSAGGRINIYEDATVDSKYGNAVRIGNATSTNSYVSIYGAEVNGDVYMPGATGQYATTLLLDNAKINGTVNADGTNTINLTHKVKIGLLDVEEGSMVTLDTLEDGTAITVQNPGAFAHAHADADSYAAYFKAAWINDKIVTKDNVLTYKTNYTMDLQLDGSNQAWCPVCMEYATWVALADDSNRETLAGGHRYLTKDLVYAYEGTSSVPSALSTGTSGTTCLHLNGHDITATSAQAIFGGESGLNIMGSGTVSGYGTGSSVGAAIHCNNKNAVDGVSLYSGTYLSLRSSKGVISMGGNGGVVRVYEDAVIGTEGSAGVAVNTGVATSRACEFYLYGGTVNGNIVLPGASGEYASVLNTDNGTVNGTVSITGTNDVTFSGRTNIGQLVVAEGSTVNFENMLSGSAVKVSAVGTFTPALEDPDTWLQYFTWDNTDDWVIVRDKCLYYGARAEVTAAEQTDIDALLLAYADRVAKYGEMHNHTGAGPQADGWNTLAEWKTEMEKLGMSFATIVDHKQVAHMYHDDWITEPTEDSDVVFVGGSEPATHVTDLGLTSETDDFHYNMLINDPEKLLEIITNTGKFTIKEFANYADFSGNSYNDTNNKAMLYDPTEYSADPDGVLQIWNYPKFLRAEFESLVDAIYDAGGLLVHVHPKYSSYMVSDNPLDYFYGGDAGTGDGTAMGIEIHTSTSSNHSPSRSVNENAYQMWVDLLELGKKAYAAYGNDNHRLPTAHALTTMYVSAMADSDEYLGYMHNGDYTPGWVGIRMQIGDASMGGETDFAGQRLVFSVGDMYSNENTASYDTFDPSYNPDHEYVVQLYDDGGLLMESEVDPGQMNYFAIDAASDAKYYRVVVWDMTQGYRCGVSNPIWNTNVTETAE